MSRRGKQWLMVAWDAGAAVACLWLAVVLRLGVVKAPEPLPWWFLLLPAAVVPPIFWALAIRWSIRVVLPEDSGP